MSVLPSTPHAHVWPPNGKTLGSAASSSTPVRRLNGTVLGSPASNSTPVRPSNGTVPRNSVNISQTADSGVFHVPDGVPAANNSMGVDVSVERVSPCFFR